MRPSVGRLGRPLRYAVYAVSAALWASGAVWVAAHFFLIHAGEYGPQKSPIEGWALVAHGGLAMVALWTFGWLWGRHVLPGWERRRGRLSGGLLVTILLVLTVTGYGLYYLGDEHARDLASWLHWGLGLAAAAFFVLHRFAPKVPAQRTCDR